MRMNIVTCLKICIKCKYLALELLTNNQLHFCLPSFWRNMDELCNFKRSKINYSYKLLVTLICIVGPYYFHDIYCLSWLLDNLDTLDIDPSKKRNVEFKTTKCFKVSLKAWVNFVDINVYDNTNINIGAHFE